MYRKATLTLASMLPSDITNMLTSEKMQQNERLQERTKGKTKGMDLIAYY